MAVRYNNYHVRRMTLNDRERKFVDDCVCTRNVRPSSSRQRDCNWGTNRVALGESGEVKIGTANSNRRKETLPRRIAIFIGSSFIHFLNKKDIVETSALAVNIDRRQRLLDLCRESSSSDIVTGAIEDLVANDKNPTLNAGSSELLSGTWKLLWSSDSAEVTRFTKYLPIGFTSLQLIGEEAGLRKGRAANIISVLGGYLRLRLSSSALPSNDNPDSVIIGPPFIFELLVGKDVDKAFSIPLGSESSVNSDESALLGSQLNTFTQLYLESSGQAGDIRVSKVTEGDPVVIGSTFVHVRL